MAKGLTPEQRFKQLFDLSNDEATTPHEREVARRKWQEWLTRHGKKPIDISSILTQAERDDLAANPPPQPQPSPPPDPIHPFDDPRFNPATLLEEFAGNYVTMRPHVRVIFVLWIIATYVHDQFRVAPRVLLTSEEPDSGKTTALEIARSLMFRANEESFATDAAIREHLSQGPCSVALDEGDLYDPEARRALLRLWNLGHAQGTTYSMKVGGQRRVFNLFAPMIAAGLGRILGQAQLSRTLILRMTQYGAGDAPKFNWWAPADDGADSVAARKTEIDVLRNYLWQRAADWKLNHRPSTPADVVRSLLAIAEACGKDWPQRAHDAIVALISEMNAEQPKTIIVRHGLVLFSHFDTDWFEVGHFNRELLRLSEPEFDWNQYRGASGLDAYLRPISISEQGRLLGKSKIKSHPMWPPGLSKAQRRHGDCQRVYRRYEFEDALLRMRPAPPVLRLIEPSGK
jgi:hypothetical protein